jgi:hypothetical protein
MWKVSQKHPNISSFFSQINENNRIKTRNDSQKTFKIQDDIKSPFTHSGIGKQQCSITGQIA